MSGATAEEFKTWESVAKKCTISELQFIIKDCREAQLAMHGWNLIRRTITLTRE